LKEICSSVGKFAINLVINTKKLSKVLKGRQLLISRMTLFRKGNVIAICSAAQL
jgi:hypothetical protein